MKKRIEVDQILLLIQLGVIGRIEARNWLENNFKGFSRSRRSDVDVMLEKYGEEIERENNFIGDLETDGDE